MKKAKTKMKMWCLCRKKDGRPIKIGVYVNADEAWAIGFSTKKELIQATDVVIEHDEEIRRIEFEY